MPTDETNTAVETLAGATDALLSLTRQRQNDKGTTGPDSTGASPLAPPEQLSRAEDLESRQHEQETWCAELKMRHNELDAQARTLDERFTELSHERQLLNQEHGELALEREKMAANEHGNVGGEPVRDMACREAESTLALLRAEIEEAEHQLASFKGQLETDRRQRAELETLRAQLERECGRLEQERADLSRQRAELEAERTALSAQADKLADLRARLEERCSELERHAQLQQEQRPPIRTEPVSAAAVETTEATRSDEPTDPEDALRRLRAAGIWRGDDSEGGGGDAARRTDQTSIEDAEPEQVAAPVAEVESAIEPPTVAATHTSAASSEEDELQESIDEYMSKLLARARQGAPKSSQAPADSATSSRPSSSAANPSTAGNRAARDGSTERTTVQTKSTTASTPATPRPRTIHPPTDIAAMRELANLSAKVALDEHARRRRQANWTTKLSMTLLALGSALFLILMSERGSASWYGGMAALVIAVFAGVQLAVATGRLRVDRSGGLTLVPNDNAEQRMLLQWLSTMRDGGRRLLDRGRGKASSASTAVEPCSIQTEFVEAVVTADSISVTEIKTRIE